MCADDNASAALPNAAGLAGFCFYNGASQMHQQTLSSECCKSAFNGPVSSLEIEQASRFTFQVQLACPVYSAA